MDTFYLSSNKNVEKSKIEYRNFLIKLINSLNKKYPFRLFIGFNFIYKAERELHSACNKLKIPFVVLFKESVLSKSQIKYYSYAYKKNNEKFKGTKIAVYSNLAKNYLINSKIVNKKQVNVVGCPRLSASFSYKKILPKNQIVYFAIEKYRGLPNVYLKIFGKKFFKNLKNNNLYKNHYNWIKLHKMTMKILKKFAINNPNVSILIKTKTGEKYNENQFNNLPKNIKIFNAGVGHGFLQNSKIVIGWNSTIVLEAIAANRFILLPYFHKKNKFLSESELNFYLKKENYGYTEKDFYKKLTYFMKRQYKKNKNYNNQKSLDYYLGNINNKAGLRLNNFLIENLNYKNYINN